jgi:hypothetical protein
MEGDDRGATEFPSDPGLAHPLLWEAAVQTTTLAHPETRVLRRYANRKIYDPYQSRYVNHAEIAALVRAGSQVKVLEQRTQRDVTVLALARILSQEEDRGLATREEALFGLLRTDERDGGEELPPANEPVDDRAAPRPTAERVVDQLLCHGQRGAFVARRLLADHVAAVARLEGRARERGETAAAVVAGLGAVRGQLERIARRLERLDESLQAADELG